MAGLCVLQSTAPAAVEADGLAAAQNAAESNPGYSIFLTGNGLGATVAEYVMQQLSANPIAGTAVGGIAFGGLSIPGGSANSNFETILNSIDPWALAVNPLGAPEGTVYTLTPTLQDLYGGQVVSVLAEGARALIGKIFEQVAQNTILNEVGSITDYASTLLADGYITSNPLAGANPFGEAAIKTFFNLKAAFPTITGYNETLTPSANVLAVQTGTISADGVTQTLTYTNFTDGTATLQDSEDPDGIQASQTATFNASGAVESSQAQFQNATIKTSGGDICDVTGADDGALLGVFFPASVTESDLEFVENDDGTSQFEGVATSTGAAQELIGFASGTLSGDTVQVAANSSGDQSIVVELTDGGTLEVTADSVADTDVSQTRAGPENLDGGISGVSA